MSIGPINSTRSTSVSSYVRTTLLALAGIGSAAGVTGSYLHLKKEIDGLGSTNTVLTQRLNESETARANLAKDAEKTNATIARLEQGLRANGKLIEEHKTALENVGKDVKSRNERVNELNKQLG